MTFKERVLEIYPTAHVYWWGDYGYVMSNRENLRLTDTQYFPNGIDSVAHNVLWKTAWENLQDKMLERLSE